MQEKTGNTLFKNIIQPWAICGLGMLFYCYNYFMRVSPSVMQEDLMQNLHINAYQFGTLAAFYYYAYTPMQIPVGMIYDRLGIRFVQFFAVIITVIGVGVFMSAPTYSQACLGRFLIGLGAAFSYIGVLKLASVWLPTNRFATAAGMTTALGMLAAIFSDEVLTKFVASIGYQSALKMAFMVGIGLCFIILVFMRSKPKTKLAHLDKVNHEPMSMKELFTALREILANKQIWIIGAIGCLFYLPASVFLDLWGIPYLVAAHGLTHHEAASSISLVFLGWIISGPSIGALSDNISKRKLPLLISSVFSTIMICIVFYTPGISLTTLNIAFFFLGIFCGAHPLCFALGKENSTLRFSGTAVAVTNSLIMLGGLIFQPVVGMLLDKHAGDVVLENGIPLYSAADYTYALSIIPIGLLISIILTFLLKETHCKSVVTSESKKIVSKNDLAYGVGV